MDLSSERRIAAPAGRVWHTLNDPEAIRRLLPGCARLERTADREFSFAVGAPAIPAPHEYVGHAHVLDSEPERRLRIGFEGDVAESGFARGEALAELAAVGETTVLRTTLEAHSGGALAATWGGPETARRLLDGFMDALAAELGGTPARELGAEGPAGVIAAATAPGATQGTLAGLLAAIPAEPFGYPRVAWIGGFLFVLIFLLIFSAYI
jgi:carbon monoxide dehydrogenase subunit G